MSASPLRDHPFALLAAQAGLSWEEAVVLAGHISKTAVGQRSTPVSVKEFVESPDYMNAAGILYPAVLDELAEMNSGRYDEVVLTGGIGVAKSTAALYTQAYQLYLLSLYDNPHAAFRLDPASEIVIIFQNLNATLARVVEYERFKEMLDRSPYFQRRFPYNKRVKSELKFPNRIIVKPVNALETAAIGQNVISAVLDEVNFFPVIEKSKLAVDGLSYDKAVALYTSIRRRRESRFMTRGDILPGIICLVSSKRFPGQFTDRKAEEAREDIRQKGVTRTYIYDKRLWEVAPPDRFSGKWFKVFIGDPTRKPFIMGPEDAVAPDDQHLVMAVPEEYRRSFEGSLYDSLRDVGGVSTQAISPFILEVDKVRVAFGKCPAIISRPDCDFVGTELRLLPKMFYRPEQPRFGHVDLGLTGDAAGVACGMVDKFVKIDRDGEEEILPVIRYDFTLEVRPPRNGEIEFSKIRGLFYKVRELGLALKWVSFDSFQSVDSLQILSRQGFITGLSSMDKDPRPYDFTKQAFYDGRLLLPSHDRAVKQFTALERNPKNGKVDHPPGGGKDISDAIAGVCFGLTMQRNIWLAHGIPPRDIAKSVLKAASGKQEPTAPEAPLRHSLRPIN